MRGLAAGMPVDLSFEGELPYEIPLLLFDHTSRASEVRMIGDGRARLRPHSRTSNSTIAVGAGSPPLTIQGLIFELYRNAPAISVLGTDSQLAISNCSFLANPASAMHIAAGDVTIRHGVFAENGEDTIRGGAVQVVGEARATFDTCLFRGNRGADGGAMYLEAHYASIMASDFVANSAATGGGVSVRGPLAVANFSNSRFEANNATVSGGALAVSQALVTIGAATLLSANIAPLGASINLDSGSLVYVLPAPLGYWISNAIECKHYPLLDVQPCDIERHQGLWTSTFGVGPTDNDFPFQCAPGLYGDSLEPAAQAGPRCSGLCPSGFFCTAGTVTPTSCPPGSFCSVGSPAAFPCPEGTYGQSMQLRSASECTPCPYGHSCSIGSTIPRECSAGSIAGTTRMASCDRCESGKCATLRPFNWLTSLS